MGLEAEAVGLAIGNLLGSSRADMSDSTVAPPPGEDGAEWRTTAEVLGGEVREFVRAHELRRRQLPRAILLGLAAGLTAVAFSRCLVFAEAWRARLLVTAHALGPWGVVLPMAFGAVGVAAALSLVRYLAPETSGSGIPHVKAVLYHLRPMRWQRIVGVKFVAGTLGIGAGLALGREGPTIQITGALGQMVSRWFRCTERERQTLIAAGAGAGLAAAFNAPLAGLIFVLEEIQRDFAPAVLTVTLVAAVTADVVARLLLGQLPVFHVATHPIPPLHGLPVSFVVGLVAAFLGVAFNRSLRGAMDAFQRISAWPPWVTGALLGGAVGALGWVMPGMVGGGHQLVERTLTGSVSLPVLLFTFPARFLLTMVSYGSGAAGGIFAPLLVLGSEIGLAIGWVAREIAPQAIDHPETFAVVGMAAYFSAIVRAPLTGIVLIVEMTGDYSLVLPLLLACLTAYGIADFLGDLPVYEALLERELLRGGPDATLGGALLLTVTVAPGAPFEGMRVADLGLPAGCVLVTVRRGLGEEVPTADLRLLAGDQVTAVVSPRAVAAAGMLFRGAGR